MARSEARISVSIWDDADFLALSMGAQRLFLFLCSQPDLAHDGVIALRERRWSKKAAGLTLAQITDYLTELEKARFVIIDDDAEELLVRSFIRRDKVFRQPNVLRSAADHLKGLTSEPILRAIATELDRVTASDDVPAGSIAILAEMRATLRSKGITAGRDGSPKSSQEGTQNPTGGTPGERGVVTAVSSASPSPVPQASDPRPRPSAGGRASTPAGDPGDAPTAPPPNRCDDHLDDPDPPPCGRCADARKRRERWDRNQAAAAAAERSRQAHERAEATAAAVNACNRCNHHGRLPGGILCAHDPASADRSQRGAAAARAALTREQAP